MTAPTSGAFYAGCERLVVLRISSPQEAEIIYDGPGKPVWERAGKLQKNGQRCISLNRLCKITAAAEKAAAREREI